MTAMLRKAEAAAGANDAPQAPDDEGTPVSVKIRERILAVRAIKAKRFAKSPQVRSNAQMTSRHLKALPD